MLPNFLMVKNALAYANAKSIKQRNLQRSRIRFVIPSTNMDVSSNIIVRGVLWQASNSGVLVYSRKDNTVGEFQKCQIKIPTPWCAVIWVLKNGLDPDKLFSISLDVGIVLTDNSKKCVDWSSWNAVRWCENIVWWNQSSAAEWSWSLPVCHQRHLEGDCVWRYFGFVMDGLKSKRASTGTVNWSKNVLLLNATCRIVLSVF